MCYTIKEVNGRVGAQRSKERQASPRSFFLPRDFGAVTPTRLSRPSPCEHTGRDVSWRRSMLFSAPFPRPRSSPSSPCHHHAPIDGNTCVSGVERKKRRKCEREGRKREARVWLCALCGAAPTALDVPPFLCCCTPFNPCRKVPHLARLARDAPPAR